MNPFNYFRALWRQWRSPASTPEAESPGSLEGLPAISRAEVPGDVAAVPGCDPAIEHRRKKNHERRTRKRRRRAERRARARGEQR